nr:hypothetical protein [Gammaproteobacteria bacterium]
MYPKRRGERGRPDERAQTVLSVFITITAFLLILFPILPVRKGRVLLRGTCMDAMDELAEVTASADKVLVF